MDKSDAPTVRSGTRYRIDQANAGRLQILQGSDEVRHGVRDMMHSFAALDQVACDRTIGVGWSNQFDPARPGAKRGDLNRLLGEQEPLTAGKSKRPVTRQCLVEVGHNHRDMVQPGIFEPGSSFIGASH